MKILFISSCSGKKNPENKSVTCEIIDKYGLEELKARGCPQTPAFAMYNGKEHLLIKKAVIELQQKNFNLDWYIFTAGFGLINYNFEIVPYECTFNKMGNKKIRERAEKLGIDVSFKKIVDENYDILLILLGSKYLIPLDLDIIPETTDAYILCGKNQRLPKEKKNIHRVDSSKEQAKKLNTTNYILKGHKILSFAKNVKEDDDLRKTDLVLQLFDSQRK